ncbi:zinc transport system substrate-binding protein [Octadecabacter temperatus]|uniref:High-affinity zinc uptake system protein ZnuA n=2 Tax=Octadecabacter temperatus TaxID=1458307 RepID=A0A0K0Y6U2_9RHOB|nr:High-affinity zinc uptake system protein ZnuA precursor [Octadecabacter temperatus]SIO19324.1 zinc transport system substrate-binding protein [Octadecabacter temperatus]
MLYNHIGAMMSRNLLSLSLTATLMGGTAFADAPSVAVDIAPVHSLVARVMDGVGTPDLIVQSGASPHEYSLRPSEASALQNADLVFWVGEDLSPWLEDAIENLAPDASVTELLEADETLKLEFREGALFEAHDHGDEDDHDDHDEDHDDHDEDHDDHDDHAEADGHEGHNHGAHDPHAWLSPNNASAWLNVIAAQLSAADPENAGTYYANATAGRAEIEAMMAEVNATLEPVRGGKFVVFHDAYQYFETDFDFAASGAISIGDASDPSPARIAEVQARVAEEGIACVLSEPQFNAGLVATVLDGSEAKTGVIDPLGSELEVGADLYPQLISNIATVLSECLE